MLGLGLDTRNRMVAEASYFRKVNTMYEDYLKLKALKGCKDSDVAKATGITKSTFSDWKSGRSTPKNDKLQKIANYFDVSLEYLTSGVEKKEVCQQYYSDADTATIVSDILNNPDMRSLFDIYRKMTPEKLKVHLEFLKKLQESANGSI